MNMTIVVEPACRGLEHAAFNAGILRGVRQLSPHGVLFMAEAEHLSAVRECLEVGEAARIEFRPLVIPPRRLRRFQERFWIDWSLLRAVWQEADRRKASAIVLTSTLESGWLAVKVRMALSRRARPVGVFFHGVLSSFLYSRKRRWLLVRGHPAGLRALLLSDSIREGMLERVPEFAPHCHTVPHPSPEGLWDGSEPDWKLIRFAYLGLASRSKGFDEFLRLAATVTSVDAAEVGAHFELIGACPEEYRVVVHRALLEAEGARDRLDLSVKPVPLPLGDYRERLSRTDYVILPYSQEAYRFTCSGAALDAVAAARPIIAYDTPGLRELFTKMGDIGYLCSGFEEMLSTVRAIMADPPRERYRAQQERLRQGREWFGTAAVATALERALGLERQYSR